MVIESCTRIIYEAERLKRFDNASTNEMAATLIAKALGSTLFICRQSVSFIFISVLLFDISNCNNYYIPG